MGRVSTVSGKIDGGDSVTAYTYDGNGNVIKESVTSNKPGETTAYRNTYYQYDSMNRLIKTNTDEPGETMYEYDDNGNITKMTTGAVDGAGGVSTTYEYDSQNRLVKTTDPMGYTETYTYDNNGNVASMTDKNGTVTTNTYNAVNNLLNSASVKDTTTQTTTYTYGAASGVLLGISDDNSSISYSYNKKGQQTGESRSTGETLTYTYDKDGNQTGMTMSANNGGISQNLSYTYNYLGQMTEVKDNAANEVIAAYTYDGNGNITEKKTNGNSMITEYTYNESGLIKTVENQTVADPLRNIKGTYSKYSYNYYLDGNQSDITDVFNKTKTYTYDGAGRLKTEGDGNDWVTYYYDERGNRSIKHDTRGDEAIYYSYNANNMLTGTEINLLESGVIPMSILPVKEENTSYQYDKNGNVISMHRWIYENPYIGDDEDYIYTETNLKEETYEYDLLNRLTSYSQTNHEEGESVSADYAYDPTGMRISKKLENENQINYVWSGGNIIGEYGIDGSKTYLRGAGGEIVKTKDGNSEERYFAYNGHGDTTSIIEKDPENVSFGVTATYEYDAFGNELKGSETGETHENSFRYNCQQVDEESGLIYLRNRYYNPEIGRFITEDPYWNVNNMIYGEDGSEEDEVKMPDSFAIIQSVNLYIYCMSNPVNLADLLGTVAYEWFSSIDDAVKDWAWNYYAKTDYSRFEQMSAIYMIFNDAGDIYYTYGYGTDSNNPHITDPSVALSYTVEGLYQWESIAIGVVHSQANSTDFSAADVATVFQYGLGAIYAVVPSEYGENMVDIKVYHYTRGDGYMPETVVTGMNYDRSYLTEEKRAYYRDLYQNRWDIHNQRGGGVLCDRGFNCPQYDWPNERW